MIIITSLFLFILGTAIGSFLNVVIDRIPRDESLNGRSHCDYCKHVLGPLDLFPLFSFIFLGGKCRYCKKRLSFQYPLIELMTGVLFVVVYIGKFQVVTLELFAYLGLTACLIAIFVTDLKEQIIPDELQIALLILITFLHAVSGSSVVDLGYSVTSGLIVAGPILALHLLTKGRGMGFGDVKLAFNIGFLYGWAKGLLVLYVGFIFGAVVGIILLLGGIKKMKSKIAFGPFLVLGVFVFLFFDRQIIDWILQIYGF